MNSTLYEAVKMSSYMNYQAILSPNTYAPNKREIKKKLNMMRVLCDREKSR